MMPDDLQTDWAAAVLRAGKGYFSQALNPFLVCAVAHELAALLTENTLLRAVAEAARDYLPAMEDYGRLEANEYTPMHVLRERGSVVDHLREMLDVALVIAG